MNLAALWIAVRNRLLADTAAGGLFAPGATLITGVFENFVPETQQAPFIVYDVESAVNEDAFRTAVYPVLFRISVYVDADVVPSTAASEKAATIINRVRGDWEAQTYGTQPGYGLTRFRPTLTGNWTADIFEHRESRALHESGTLHYVESYRTYMSRAGA